jgi:hypothetical protein
MQLIGAGVVFLSYMAFPIALGQRRNHVLLASAAFTGLVGYGLVKKQLWGLYLLAAGFAFTVFNLVRAAQRGATFEHSLLPFRLIWLAIGLWYFLEHRRDLQ